MKALLIYDQCVVQKNGPEKDQQIRQMGAIYSSAQFVIIAAAGVDPSNGLSGVTRERQTVCMVEPINSKFLRLRSPGVWDSIDDSVWITRAWS